jgi:5-methyltetrahydropteroyltriglutamate--homocysteine methyltransferase
MSDVLDDIRTVRVDQIGSLVNPPALLEAFRAFEAGSLSEDELSNIQDEAIIATIRKQESIGFPVVTDGEMRRRNFQDNFGHSVSGFDVPKSLSYQQALSGITEQVLARAEQNFAAAGPAILTRRPVIEKLKLVRNIPLEEYHFADKHTQQPIKATILSPDRIVQRFAYEDSRKVYPDREAFLADVIDISRQMIRGLVDAGCRYIQIDAPGYTAYVDDVSLERMKARGEDPQANMEMSIKADNAIIEGFGDVVFGIHLCRGNARTRDPQTGKVAPQFHREGAYDAIAEKLFNSLNHDRWLLEYDSERAGGFEPLKHMPKGHIAVLGIVTTKSSDIEPADFLKRRIDEAARFIPADQLAISPQCGFGGFGHPTISQDEQWRKLEQLKKVADAVWN